MKNSCYRSNDNYVCADPEQFPINAKCDFFKTQKIKDSQTEQCCCKFVRFQHAEQFFNCTNVSAQSNSEKKRNKYENKINRDKQK